MFGKKKVKVNILDPMGGHELEDFLEAIDTNIYQIKQWIVGEDVSRELYEKWVDPKNKELYLLTVYKQGNRERYFTTRQLWHDTYNKMR